MADSEREDPNTLAQGTCTLPHPHNSGGKKASFLEQFARMILFSEKVLDNPPPYQDAVAMGSAC